MYAGVTGNGVLIAAGGANFPDAPPWAGGTKTWTDAIYAMNAPDGQWRMIGKLPKPMGYGVSVPWDGGVLLIGGSDADHALSDVLLLRLPADGKPTYEALPSLPSPCTQMCGALIGTTIYIAGGIDDPNATTALRTCWAMDLAAPASDRMWRVIDPWPGPGRMQSVAGTSGGMFYLFGRSASSRSFVTPTGSIR